ncbi:phosphoribosylglycinamide formyltransferase [uncultured Pigmentiphaga sp.]|uniref:phosphoribosylglycinamide formyltransferase n=1 Tax=uncultured Pigmentiphaga sp. TaxID=340361 RepID=UPI00262DC8FC|nr:phosphoribosylglycinamide formyltransferase [uncultured Pigmentiphaga sp.]
MKAPLFSSARRCRFVILISGRGSNMQSIVRACREQGWPAEVAAVISNREDASGLQWAASQGIPTRVVPHRDYADRVAFDAALAREIDAFEPDFVLLAGFMRILTEDFVRHYADRLINIHPSLLPLFPGLGTHRQALEAGVAVHGCTVHFVTPVLDHGPIIAQGVVPVMPGDTEEALAERVLGIEHVVYPTVASWLAHGKVSLEAGKVVVRDVADRAFLWSAPAVSLEKCA